MAKINLNSLVKPKIFWPSIIILLAICITLYAQKEKEKSIRIAKETELLRTVEAKKVVENKLTEAEKQIAARDEQIKLALDKLEKEVAARKDLEAQLVTVVKEKQDLALQIEQLSARVPKNIELEKIVIKPISELNGKVLSIDKVNSFLIVDLGSANNLNLGDVLSVYHDNNFIGKVQVEKIEEKTSAAVILSPWKNVEFKENDVVKRI
jgi:HSP90 family molecular chaperone